MHQNATWYGGRPQPRRLCVRWGPSSPSAKEAQPPIFDQCPLWRNGWIGLRCHLVWRYRPQPRRLCVRRGPSSPQKKRHSPTQFLDHVYCGQIAGWIKMPLGSEPNGGKPQPMRRCVRWGRSSLPHPAKRGTAPSFRCMSIVAKRLDG